MGDPKYFGVGIQIFQWYGYNDLNCMEIKRNSFSEEKK